MLGGVVTKNYFGLWVRIGGFFLRLPVRSKNSSDAEALTCPSFSFISACIALIDRQLARNFPNSSPRKFQSKRSSISSERNLSIKHCHSLREALDQRKAAFGRFDRLIQATLLNSHL